MRSGRATVGEPRKNADLERTRDQKRRSNSSANADPEPIGDRTRTEEPGLVTNRLKANSSARASIRMRPPKPSRGGFRALQKRNDGNVVGEGARQRGGVWRQTEAASKAYFNGY